MRNGNNLRKLGTAALCLAIGGLAASTGATDLKPGSDSPSRNGKLAVGMTADHRLVVFKLESPSRAKEIGAITGLVGDTSLVGIDYRPKTGVLYALGNGGGVYTIDEKTAVATLRVNLDPPTPLVGTSFDVDFNPTVDRMRVVSDAGQNLRINVETGATTSDPGLNNGAVPPVAVTGVSGAAYTNNDADPNTNTTLFDVNAALDQVAIQSPANAGAVVATGGLLVDAGADVGFDIYSRLKNGVVDRRRAYLVATVAGPKGPENNAYRINLLTGAARKTGRFDTQSPVVDLAIPTDRVSP